VDYANVIYVGLPLSRNNKVQFIIIERLQLGGDLVSRDVLPQCTVKAWL